MIDFEDESERDFWERMLESMFRAPRAFTNGAGMAFEDLADRLVEGRRKRSTKLPAKTPYRG